MTPEKEKALHIIASLSGLKRFALEVHDNAKNHGFHDKQKSDDDFINYQGMNLIVEIAERHEAWRKGDFHKPCDKTPSMVDLGLDMLTCAQEEYADEFIRILDQCERLGIDLLKAVAYKHIYNTTRPYMHGNKKS